MVYTGVAEERDRDRGRDRERVGGGGPAKSMAMGSERAKPLHNFNLPFDLKWGSQKHLRCMKVSSDAGGEASAGDRRSRLEISSATMTRRRESSWTEFEKRRFRPTRAAARMTTLMMIENDDVEEEEEEEGIEAVREKLMFDLKTAADKMKDAIFREEVAAAADADVAAAAEDEDVEMTEAGESSPAPPVPAAEVRPWNLRTRRAACKAPVGGGVAASKGLRIEEKKANYSPLRSECGGGGYNSNSGGVKPPRLIRGASSSGSGSGQEKKKEEEERPKFSVTLTKKEIEEDFMAMLGHRPPRRPKRRPRNVQKQLDGLFPGTWLTEVSAEAYKVPEFPENTGQR